MAKFLPVIIIWYEFVGEVVESKMLFQMVNEWHAVVGCGEWNCRLGMSTCRKGKIIWCSMTGGFAIVLVKQKFNSF
jgi:hypothetical protein